MPDVSIIMPNYNGDRFIAETIESVLAQTYADWELIICDDASSDGSAAIVQAYAARDSRIRLIANAANKGSGPCRNQAIAQARGEYIAFLDSDDKWYPEKLARQMAAMRAGNWDICHSAYDVITERGKRVSTVTPPRLMRYGHMVKGQRIGMLTGVMRRALVKEFPPRRTAQDVAMWLAALRGGAAAHALAEPLAAYRLREGSASSRKWRTAHMFWRILREQERIALPRACYYFFRYMLTMFKKYAAILPDVLRLRSALPALALVFSAMDARAETPFADEPVFVETFTQGVSSKVWDIRTGPGNKAGQPGGQQQYYTALALQTDADGLHIAANRNDDAALALPYTSGSIYSKQSFRYGKFEWVARLPKGDGLWPALWLVAPKDGKPGEIDIVEGFGGHTDSFQSTLHVWEHGKYARQHCVRVGAHQHANCRNATKALPATPDLSEAMHVYTLEWLPDRLVFARDGVVYYTEMQDVPDMPMRLVLNLAVGANFAGPVTEHTIFPAFLDVKSVKVWAVRD